jgi:hypothetical protein
MATRFGRPERLLLAALLGLSLLVGAGLGGGGGLGGLGVGLLAGHRG